MCKTLQPPVLHPPVSTTLGNVVRSEVPGRTDDSSQSGGNAHTARLSTHTQLAFPHTHSSSFHTHTARLSTLVKCCT